MLQMSERLRVMSERMNEMGERMSERMGEVSGRMSERMGEMSGRMNEMKTRMGTSMGDVGTRMSGQADDLRSRVSEGMGTLGERMPRPEHVRGLARKVGIAAENPLGLALGAAALGFLVGLLVPVTDYEREKIGPLRDEVVDKVQTVGEDVVVHGRAVIAETAQATLAAAQQSAQQHGQQLIAGGLDPQTLVTNAYDHGKQLFREATDVAINTARRSAEEHGRTVMENARANGGNEDSSAMDSNRVELDRTGMTGDTGPASGTRPRSGQPGDIGDTALSPGMPSDAAQGGGLRAGTKLEGGSGAQTPHDTGSTSSQYSGLLDDQRPEGTNTGSA
jgi:uncharacterized protein YjbJ (UPF0337 family)